MNWANELCDLYDKNKAIAGKMDFRNVKTKKGEERIPLVLLPPFHTTVTAQIAVTIDWDGNFLSARPVENEDKLTVIPVTEKSGSRTAGKEPHPFCDNLKYLAGDYAKYSKEAAEEMEKYHGPYMKNLEDWSQSAFSHKKVKALYSYLSKSTLIKDLITANVLKLDEDGRLTEHVKIQNLPQNKAFVRFRIMNIMDSGEDILKDQKGRFATECWLDQTLQDSFINYYRAGEGKKEICYLSGNLEQSTYLHSKKIRNEGDGAKLISSNDEANFTYRGRFSSKEQAFVIGNETSQKLHNALKWIIRRQGFHLDSLCMVSWESDLQPMPKWDGDTDNICEDSEEGWGDEEEQPCPASDGNTLAAGRFQSAMMGYSRNLDNFSRMVLMVFDAATTGRLALMECKSLESARYLENIEYWHHECEWLQLKYKDKKVFYYMGMAGVRDVADSLYGTEQNGVLSIPGKGRLYAETATRLLPCIWDRRNLPADFVNLAVQRASSPLAYKKRYNWERILALACSFIKKQRHERNPKEVWTLALNEESSNRDYLFGRLLAVADRIEYRTYDKEKDSGRETNAKRYMCVFAQRPFETWKVIEENLQPYLLKLKAGERIRYLNLIDEICQGFDEASFSDNNRLDGLYLLGFHSQSYALKHVEEKSQEE